MNDDIVSVPVPKQFLPQVIRLLAGLYGESGPGAVAPPVVTTAKATNDDHGWGDIELLRRNWRESPPAMHAILLTLARQPDIDVPITALARAAYGGEDLKCRQQIAGALGSFGKRAKNRYGLTTWPFDGRYAYERDPQIWVYRMRADMAARIREIADESAA